MQGGTTSCRALLRGSPSHAFLHHAKMRRINSSLLGETGLQRLSHWVVVFTSPRVFAPQVVCYSSHLLPLAVIHFSSYFYMFFSESWGLVYNIKNERLLKVEIALVNTCSCKDLLLSKSLVESCLVDIAAGMDNKILSAMARKRAQGIGDSSNAPTPQKRNNVGSTKIPTPK